MLKLRSTPFLFMLAIAITSLFPCFTVAQEVHLTPQVGHFLAVQAIDISLDGQQLLTVSSHEMKLWQVGSGRLLYSRITDAEISCAKLSPDGKQILTGDATGEVQILNIVSGAVKICVPKHADKVMSVAFSADGRLALSGSKDASVHLYDTESGQLLRNIYGFARSVTAVDFSPGATHIIVGCGDSFLRLINTKNWRVERTYSKQSAPVISAAFSSDGKYIAAGYLQGGCCIWDRETGELISAFGNTLIVNEVAFSPDNTQILTASWDGQARLWHTATGKLLRSFDASLLVGGGVAFLPSGQEIITGGGKVNSGIVNMWDVKVGNIKRQFASNTLQPAILNFSPDAEKALCIGYSHEQAANAAKGQIRYSVSVLSSASKPLSIGISSDGTRFLRSGKNDVVMFDSNGNELQTFIGHQGDVRCVSFSPDGKQILSGSKDGTARLWDVESGVCLRILQGDQKEVTSLDFSSDGKQVLTGGSDGTVKLWNIDSGICSQTLVMSSSVNVVIFSVTGEYVLAGTANLKAEVWNVRTGRKRSELQGHTSGIHCAVFSPDENLVITGSADGTARLWDIAKGKELCQIIGFNDGSWAVTAPDGRYDASNGGDIQSLHWVEGVNLETIALSQMKARYYEPGLLSKMMGLDNRPLRDVREFKNVKLYPKVEGHSLEDKQHYEVKLRAREGGIGPVVVKVNGSQLFADARPNSIRQMKDVSVGQEVRFEVDVSKASNWKPDGNNSVELVAYNSENWLASPSTQLLTADAVPQTSIQGKHRLFAIIVGISDYASSKLNLRLASDDALAFSKALTLGAERLFGPNNVDIQLLGVPNTVPGSKANIKAAFDQVRQNAKPDDIFVVYLAGHGLSLPLEDSTYCYLTQDATTADNSILLADNTLRQSTSVSSSELAAWIAGNEKISGIAANYRVLILDTCAAGAAGNDLNRINQSQARSVDADQLRALDRFKGRTGGHILMSCAPDRLSYESSRYGQGVMTYALLQGMKGAKLRENQFVDVRDLFSYAEDTVPTLAGAIDKLQQPRYLKPAIGSFDIGRLSPEDRSQIQLHVALPQIIQSRLGNVNDNVDDQDLESLVRSEWLRRAESGIRGATGRQAEALQTIYVDVPSLSDGIKPVGQYRIEGNYIIVGITLVQNSRRLKIFEVRGTKDALGDLAKKIVAAIDVNSVAP